MLAAISGVNVELLQSFAQIRVLLVEHLGLQPPGINGCISNYRVAIVNN